MGRRRKSRRPAVRVRLTGAGWAFLAITFVIAVATLKSQLAMLFLIVGALVGAVVVSGLMARRQIAGVDLEREAPAQAWQCQTVHLGYYLRNTRRRSCLAVALEELPAAGIENTRAFCAHLPGGGTFRSGARFVAHRRGRLALSGVQLLSRFPFGLAVARRKLDREASLVIWPARGRLKQHMLHLGAVRVSSGPPTQATGGQDEFFGLRDYRSDDNPRWIHWRRSATRAVPVIREMCHPKPEILYIILDTRMPRAAAWDVRERLIRFVGTLVEHSLSRGYQVGLALARGRRVLTYPPAAGRGQMHLLLTALADIGDAAAPPLQATVAALRRHNLDEAQVVVATADPEVPAAVLRPVRGACRNLTVVTADRLAALFEDNPLAAAEEAG